MGAGLDRHDASSYPMMPLRIPLFDFPDVVLVAEELNVKRHARFKAAKGGDIVAADGLVADFAAGLDARLRAMFAGRQVELVPVHALETTGVNEIPVALARRVAHLFDISVSDSIVQTNSVGHTGASGYQRLARQALFEGDVRAGQAYCLVDDFVGQGGTLANLIGYINARGGEVVGAFALAGKPYSAILAPDAAIIAGLRRKHGQALEIWWRGRFGFGFDCLTRSEARYLENSPDADTIRSRLVEAGFADGT